MTTSRTEYTPTAEARKAMQSLLDSWASLIRSLRAYEREGDHYVIADGAEHYSRLTNACHGGFRTVSQLLCPVAPTGSPNATPVLESDADREARGWLHDLAKYVLLWSGRKPADHLGRPIVPVEAATTGERIIDRCVRRFALVMPATPAHPDTTLTPTAPPKSTETAPAATVAPGAAGEIGGAATSWQAIQGRLLVKRDAGEPYTSLRNLASELGCSEQMIRKAIERSQTLEGWRARSAESNAAPKASDLGVMVRDTARQRTEAAPDDYLPDDEVDTVFAILLDKAKPTERAKLNALNDEGRRALAKAYQEQNYDHEPSTVIQDEPGGRPQRVKQHKRV